MTDARPEDVDPHPDDAIAETTLSEEELVINTELVETGRVRLTKRIHVETVTRTFELRREILEIERLDQTSPERERSDLAAAETETETAVLKSGPLAPGSLMEGSIEIVLMQEEALVSKQMVPRERVRLTKDVVTEIHTIDAELSSERADLEQRPR